MKVLMEILVALVLLAVAALCVFGFLATFEPTDKAVQFMAFRIGYCVVGLGCVVGAGFLIANSVR